MIIFINNEEFLSAEELEKILKIKEVSIDLKVKFGVLPKPIKLPVRKFWKRKDIEEYLEKYREELEKKQSEINDFLQKKKELEEYLEKMRQEEKQLKIDTFSGIKEKKW